MASPILILTNARLAPGFDATPGAVAVQGGRILWVGPMTDLPSFPGADRRDLQYRVLTPAPIDCHTHLVHGGHRAREFALRLEGASYEDIARAGGGIV